MHSAALRFEDVVLRARSDARSDILWLVEFLTPQFARVRTARADWTITLRTAARAYATVVRRFERLPTPKRLVSFALDTRTLSVPSFAAGPGRLTLLDEHYGVIYGIDLERRTVDILESGVNRGKARIAFMRVLRELATNAAAARGGLLVHGGAFLLDGRAVIIAGPKNSGKTTSLLHAISRRGGRYVSNDRILVLDGEGRLRCRGIPTIVTIRSDGLGAAPRLAARLPRSGYVSYLTRREAAARRRHGPTVPDRQGRYSISPSQLCELLGAVTVAGGELSAMVFPAVTRRAGGASLRRLHGGPARRRIESGLFRAGLPPVRRPAFGVARRATGTDRALVSKLATRVPCFRLDLGRDAMADASWIAELADLLASGTRRDTRAGRAARKDREGTER
jgi:hypothetical protein